MAGFTLITSLPKFGHAGATIARASAWNPRVFAAATPRPIQVPKSPNQEGSITADGIKQGASETVNNNLNEPLQDKAYTSTTEQVANKTKDMANQASAKAQDITEKAKQTMQEAWDSTKNTANRAADTVMGKEAWDSAKNTANRAADTVLGKTEESANRVKENAEIVRENMNKKN
ncbi:hypothetical protein RIF29_38084 [Crotalaria pallida]|uniref:Late embryogenesis abundant protein n=1 Tax=Crotalaria pallida TaxID=3830 RepID=A0AAN9DZH4_CROPI